MTRERVTQSLRLLARNKTFAATAIVCLGLAIALNTTMYSVMDAVVNPRIDVTAPEQIHSVNYWGDFHSQIPVHEKDAALRDASFHSGLTGSTHSPNDRIVERGSRLRDASVLSVLPNFFAFMGSSPSAGRLLRPEDLGAEVRPVVISERLWRQLFPENDEFEPSTIFVGGTARYVVGLLPYAGAFPYKSTDIWQLPLPSEVPGIRPNLARLKPSVTLAQAETELRGITLRYRAMTGEGEESGWLIRPAYTKQIQRFNFHYSLIASVVAVLLIACANLANLQLARGVSRARELATRAAVGASRADIVWQLVLESAWLALGGLALGAVLTVWGIQLIDASVPKEIAEYMTYPQVSWRVAAVAVGATLVCLFLVGLLPAIRLSRVDVNELLKSGTGTGRTVSVRRQYGALVVVEVSLALMLLSSTGLLVRAAMLVFMFDVPEYQKSVVVATMRVPFATPMDRASRRDWSERIIAHVLREDSITGVATTVSVQPPKRAVATYDESGQPVNKVTHQWGYGLVSPDYFRTTGIPIVEGRDFSPGEFAEPQVIVDKWAARSLWPGKSAIGKQIKLDSSHTRGPWYRVVGVAEDQRVWFDPTPDITAYERRMAERARDRMVGVVWVLNADDTTVVTRPTRRDGFKVEGYYFSVNARGKGDPRRIAMLTRNNLAEMGPNVTVGYPYTWEQMTGIARIRARQSFMGTLFTVFAISALALAALGVYAIIAHMVAQRTREFGVRIAVGARERDIREMVTREGSLLTLLGITIGLLLTWKTAAWVRAFLYSDWDHFDSRVFAVMALILFVVAWVASYLPARRAMRINPVEALRND